MRDGDLVRLDVAQRRIDLLVYDGELERRRSELLPHSLPARGWARLYAQTVLPASEDADLDFLALDPADDT